MNDVHVNLVISVVNKPIEPGRIMTMNYPLENQYLRWSVVMVDIGGLTHWGQDKMAVILQMTYSDAFSLMKTFEIGL